MSKLRQSNRHGQCSICDTAKRTNWIDNAAGSNLNMDGTELINAQ